MNWKENLDILLTILVPLMLTLAGAAVMVEAYHIAFTFGVCFGVTTIIWAVVTLRTRSKNEL